MKILVVGSGGREHALCWHLRNRSRDAEVYCAPGNPGIGEEATLVPIAVDEVQHLADFAGELGIDLTIVGPELPLALGLVDEFRARGLRVFGPDQGAARLESSKIFAKEFMVRHGIPTAPFEVVHDEAEARTAAANIGIPCVFKADGLAGGKGVLIVRDEAELEVALDVFFNARRFGSAANRVIVEKMIVGDEVSFIGICDGVRFLPFATSKDYKRLGEGDEGPNTGGMGAHSPSGVVSAGVANDILRSVMQATVTGMAAEGHPFSGFLYGGLIIDEHERPWVLEYNVRLGDPEAQALLPRVGSDLAGLLAEGAIGEFSAKSLDFTREACACIVLASEGYPQTPSRGAIIEGLRDASSVEGVEVFHAATSKRDGDILVSGGRVLNVCALGATLRDALKSAYAAASEIRYSGKVLRNDIGRTVLESGEIAKSGIFKLSDLTDDLDREEPNDS